MDTPDPSVIERRTFVAGIASSLIAGGLPAWGTPPSPRMQRALIGTTGRTCRGIFTATFDAMTGAWSTPELALPVLNNDFMALAPGKRRTVYATSSAEGKAFVTAMALEDGATPLRILNQQPAGGTTGVFVSLSPDGGSVLQANYGSGSVNSYPVAKDGNLLPAVEHLEYGDADHGPVQPQQMHSRAHSILVAPGGRFVLVNDYGCDRIRVYRFDRRTSRLQPNDPAAWLSAPGTAPRHLAVHPSGRWIYSNNELSNTVDLLDWDGDQGVLKLRATWPLLPPNPPPRCRAADLLLSPDAKFLYGSNRGLDSFTAWSVERDGSLKQIQFQPSSGAENRQITLDRTGRWMIAANVGSNNLTVLPRDPVTGVLGAEAAPAALQGACFVLWV